MHKLYQGLIAKRREFAILIDSVTEMIHTFCSCIFFINDYADCNNYCCTLEMYY